MDSIGKLLDIGGHCKELEVSDAFTDRRAELMGVDHTAEGSAFALALMSFGQ